MLCFKNLRISTQNSIIFLFGRSLIFFHRYIWLVRNNQQRLYSQQKFTFVFSTRCNTIHVYASCIIINRFIKLHNIEVISIINWSLPLSQWKIMLTSIDQKKNGKKKFAKTKTNLIKLKVRSLIAKDRVYHLAKLLAYTSRRKWLIDANSIKTTSCFLHTESQASAKMIQILPVNKITIRRFIHELPNISILHIYVEVVVYGLNWKWNKLMIWIPESWISNG